MLSCLGIITPEELYAVSHWHTLLTSFVIVILLVICILLVACIRITLKQGAQVRDTRQQVVLVMQSMNKLMKGALNSQQGAQELVQQIPSKIATAVEKAVKDSEIIRRSDPPLDKPVKLPKREV
jgi:predicted Holliday junction resolvase-like endonuclease